MVGRVVPNRPASRRTPAKANAARGMSVDRPARPTARVVAEPTHPSTQPTPAPAAVDPARSQATVVAQFAPRDRSPSGVMLPSIDSPQGDQADRTPATRASPNPMPNVANVTFPLPPMAQPAVGSPGP